MSNGTPVATTTLPDDVAADKTAYDEDVSSRQFCTSVSDDGGNRRASVPVRSRTMWLAWALGSWKPTGG